MMRPERDVDLILIGKEIADGYGVAGDVAAGRADLGGGVGSRAAADHYRADGRARRSRRERPELGW